MHGIRCPPLSELFKRPTEVIEHLAVDVLNPAVGRHDGDEAGKGLDDEAEALFSWREKPPRVASAVRAVVYRSTRSPGKASRAIRRRPGHSRSFAGSGTSERREPLGGTEELLLNALAKPREISRERSRLSTGC